MIKHIQRGCLLVTAWLLFSHSLWADDSKIAAWAGQVLISTLSVNYMESDEDLNQMRAYYTLDAWNGISFFLGNYLDKVRAQKLTLHPIATRPPTITNKGRM